VRGSGVDEGVLAAVSSLLLALALTPLARAFLNRLAVLDVPTSRSLHSRPTVRGAGIACAVAALATLALFDAQGTQGLALLVTAAALAGLGMADDFVGVTPIARLAVQVAVAGGAASLLLWDRNGSGLTRSAAILAAALWTVAFVNGFNFMDGIDGISVAQVLVAGAVWWGIGAARHVSPLMIGGAVSVGAALGFAPYNVHRATVFLGDVGSYFFGALLAALFLIALLHSVPLEAAAAPLSVYLVDTGTTLVRRLARRERLLSAHRDHAYQRLVALGWSHGETVSVVLGFMVGVSLLGSVSLTASIALRAVADGFLLLLLVAYVVLPDAISRRRGRETRAMGR
jgi:UDP-N-acetylmuramyl pentapeptide phosphotransferase/UDP-N-acetylglucosamine-1-phosphate transferase